MFTGLAELGEPALLVSLTVSSQERTWVLLLNSFSFSRALTKIFPMNSTTSRKWLTRQDLRVSEFPLILIDRLKKFRRYNTPGGGGYNDYSSGRSGGSVHSDRGGYRQQDYGDDAGASKGWGNSNDDWGKSDDRYEEVKNDYHQSMKARDERPAGNVDYKNYFDSSERDRGRSPTAAPDDAWKS